MSLSVLLLLLSGFCYASAFLFHYLSFSEIKPIGHRPAFTLMRIGFLISTFYFGAETIDHGFFLPVVNFSQAMAFFAWSLGFVYLVLIVKAQTDSFGLILSPILLLLTSAAYFAKWHYGDHETVKPFLLNPYFTVHIVSAFFAYASFTLSFAAGILYLIQHHELKLKKAGTFYHKLPSLEELEMLIYQPMVWGASLLLTAVTVGIIWSKTAFGEFWIFDPKTIATVIIAIFYFVILYLRFVTSLRGKQGAVLSLFAFTLVVFSFVGMRFIQGSHQFLH